MDRGVPSTQELVEAVAEFLAEDVVPGTSGRLKFNTRVAANVLAMVQRELTLGPAVDAAHRRDLSALDFAGDAELAAEIREGQVRGLSAPLIALLRAHTAARLALSNPRHLREDDRVPFAPDSGGPTQ
jgi:hypothetical protein